MIQKNGVYDVNNCKEIKKPSALKTLGFYLVDHQGFDRLRRVACRLPPRLPARSPSERSLLECSPDILADARALAGSNRLDKKENT